MGRSGVASVLLVGACHGDAKAEPAQGAAPAPPPPRPLVRIDAAAAVQVPIDVAPSVDAQPSRRPGADLASAADDRGPPRNDRPKAPPPASRAPGVRPGFDADTVERAVAAATPKVQACGAKPARKGPWS